MNSIICLNDEARKAVRKLVENAKQLDRLVKETIEKGKPWTDKSFKPTKASLFNPEIDSADPEIFANLEWKRASKIYANPTIFNDGIDPNDVN